MAFNNIITFLFKQIISITYLECNLMLLLKLAALKMASDFNGQTNTYAWFSFIHSMQIECHRSNKQLSQPVC